MNENTSIAILSANKLMRSPEQVAAFENALAELAQHPNSQYLRELHLILDDNCQHQEVMFSLLHFLESFDVKAQIQAFIDVMPQLIISAPEWTEIIHQRILNDESANVYYQEILKSLDHKNQPLAISN
ncbi:hypothetical protein BCD67_09305 [Oscillatoriales cyanobacterium USR001]|nr:hypothetical protein BCD67_09305 [Oscillatoriales cyanobacterium USR001]